MSNSYPFPPLQVFERLQINDGLLMTADLWQRAHGYHRQRQDFTFQAINNPGIIYGLEVKAIAPPSEVPGQYRDGRWLEVQPGAAIDVAGNPIVVTEPMSFRIESELSNANECLIYLTVRHVNPDTLNPAKSDRPIRTEQFRIVEKRGLDASDIELCRILLKQPDKGSPYESRLPNAIAIRPATNVFAPSANEIDVRHRPQPHYRPDGLIRLAQLTAQTPADQTLSNQLRHLLKATETLYPRLAGCEKIERIPVGSVNYGVTEPGQAPSMIEPDPQPIQPDLICSPWAMLQELDAIAVERITTTLNEGGVLLVIATAAETGLANLYSLQQELQTALGSLDEGAETEAIRQSLAAELNAFSQDIDQQVQKMVTRLRSITQQFGHSLDGNGELDFAHLLRIDPFLFGQLPVIEAHPTVVLQWDTIVLLIGDIVRLWGPDDTREHPRHAIRTAQEFGINLLTYAWRHHTLSQMQGGYRPSASSGSSASLRDRLPPSSDR